jgi:hypothetical protein
MYIKHKSIFKGIMLLSVLTIIMSGCRTTRNVPLPATAQKQYDYLIIHKDSQEVVLKFVDFLEAYNEYQGYQQYKLSQNLLVELLKKKIDEGGDSLYAAEDVVKQISNNNLLSQKDIKVLKKLIEQRKSKVIVNIINNWITDVYVYIDKNNVYLDSGDSMQLEIALDNEFKKTCRFVISSDTYRSQLDRLNVVGGYDYTIRVRPLKKQIETVRKYIGKIRQSDDAKYIKFKDAMSLPVVDSKVNDEKFVFNDTKFMETETPVSIDSLFPVIGNLKSRLKEDSTTPSMALMEFINTPARIIADSGLETLRGSDRIAYVHNVTWYYLDVTGHTSVEYIMKADYANEAYLSDFVKALVYNSLEQAGVSVEDKGKWVEAIKGKEYLASFVILNPLARFESISKFDWNNINFIKSSGIQYVSSQGKPRVSFAFLKNDGSLVIVAFENRME